MQWLFRPQAGPHDSLVAAGGCDAFQVPLTSCCYSATVQLNVERIPLNPGPITGDSTAGFWPSSGISGISICTPCCLRRHPRRAISFALVGPQAWSFQLLVVQALMGLGFACVLTRAPAVAVSQRPHQLPDQHALTFRFHGRRRPCCGGLLGSFLLRASLPVLGERGCGLRPYYSHFFSRTGLGPASRNPGGFVWNYAPPRAFVLEQPPETKPSETGQHNITLAKFGWRYGEVERCRQSHVEMRSRGRYLAILRRGMAPSASCLCCLLETSCLNHWTKNSLAEGSACFIALIAIYNCNFPTTHSFATLDGFCSLQTSPPIPQGLDQLRGRSSIFQESAMPSDNLKAKVGACFAVAPRIFGRLISR